MPEKNLQPERAPLEKSYNLHFQHLENLLIKYANTLRSILQDKGLRVTIKYRVKSFESYFDKLLFRLRHKDNVEAYNITDILGIRIICPFLNDISMVEQIINKNFTVINSEKKGLHHTVKEFGYESLHLIINIDHPDKYKNITIIPHCCEIQISTTLQDAWAEVEHELVYKSALTPIDAPLKRKLAALNATLTLSDTIFQEIRDYNKSIQEYTIKRRDNIYIKITEGITNNSNDAYLPPMRNDETLINEEHDVTDETIDNKLLRALAAHNDGNYKKSITIYTQLLESENENHINALLLNHRGLAYMASSNYKSAEKDFLEAIKLDDDNYRSYNYLATCKRMLGDYESALKYLDNSIKINPYQSENHYFRALIYFDLGDYYKANDFCEKALNFKPDNTIFLKFKKIITKKL